MTIGWLTGLSAGRSLVEGGSNGGGFVGRKVRLHLAVGAAGGDARRTAAGTAALLELFRYFNDGGTFFVQFFSFTQDFGLSGDDWVVDGTLSGLVFG